jgi:hypothetical protein
MTVHTTIAIERYPDQSAVAYCGPCSVVLARDEPELASASRAGFPWSISLYHEADDPIVVFVAPEPAEADQMFTRLSAYLASYDGSTGWEEYVGAIGGSQITMG